MSKTKTACNKLTVVLDPPEGISLDRIQQSVTATPQEIWHRLADGPVTLDELNKSFEPHLPQLYLLLQLLWGLKSLALSNCPKEPALRIAPSTEGTNLDMSTANLNGSWKLSRFAFLRSGSDNTLWIETPKLPVVTQVLNADVGTLFALFMKPMTADYLIDHLTWVKDRKEALALLLLLRNAAIIDPCDANGLRQEDQCSSLQQWEFHDLLFHHRSRKGRHLEPTGATYRFKNHLPAPPVVKPNPWVRGTILLPRPSMTAIEAADPPFTTVLETRQSWRDQDFTKPISILKLSEFLYRSARIRSHYQTSMGEFTSRPYPSGGASYELELYISVNACEGLQRGFYYYDAEKHALCPIHAPNDNFEAILDEAWLSAARLCRPQILITIASRFHRVNWKYSGMAYAAQLKNVGVLYQTFYLVATAMNLAGCALGLGNAKRLSDMAGTNFFEESSVGEFMLGSKA